MRVEGVVARVKVKKTQKKYDIKSREERTLCCETERLPELFGCLVGCGDGGH